ncbi:MAG: D-amino acid dehydrogenase [Hyphomicrobiaceae bacterium]|nr:D-amino acid dehydrogenase [Hyphomicrobiaceae bacterium]
MTSSKQNHVAIIGAGITGTTTAYNLAKRGFKVTLFDSNRYPAMETSFANGGQLSASNAEVWNSWSTVLKGMKWIFTPGAPLLVNPKPSWHKLSWMAEFVRAIPEYEENTITTARLAIEARGYLRRMAKDEGIDFDVEDRGILHFYKSKEDYEVAERVTALLKRGGLERTPVTAEEIHSLEPALKGDIYAGFYTKSDFTGDIHKFTVGLGKACENLGVDLRFASEVCDLNAGPDGVTVVSRDTQHKGAETTKDLREETFDRIVVCAGVHSRRLARKLGDRINIYPVKGYSISVDLPEKSDQDSAPSIGLLDDNAKIVTSRLGENRFRVAGTAEFNGFNRSIPKQRIDPLIIWCRYHFPDISTRQCIPWAGLRPMMPNMMPRAIQGRNPRVFYNTGHGHLGWTLSAATAEAVGALVEAGAMQND